MGLCISTFCCKPVAAAQDTLATQSESVRGRIPRVGDCAQQFLVYSASGAQQLPGRLVRDIDKLLPAAGKIASELAPLSLEQRFSRLDIGQKKALWLEHAIGGNLQTIQFFIAGKVGADIVNAIDDDGDTALKMAISDCSNTEREKIILTLLQAMDDKSGASAVNIKDALVCAYYFDVDSDGKMDRAITYLEMYQNYPKRHSLP